MSTSIALESFVSAAFWSVEEVSSPFGGVAAPGEDAAGEEADEGVCGDVEGCPTAVAATTVAAGAVRERKSSALPLMAMSDFERSTVASNGMCGVAQSILTWTESVMMPVRGSAES